MLALLFRLSFSHADGGGAYAFRVPPDKVIVFAKPPHGQTTFRAIVSAPRSRCVGRIPPVVSLNGSLMADRAS